MGGLGAWYQRRDYGVYVIEKGEGKTIVGRCSIA